MNPVLLNYKLFWSLTRTLTNYILMSGAFLSHEVLLHRGIYDLIPNEQVERFTLEKKVSSDNFPAVRLVSQKRQETKWQPLR